MIISEKYYVMALIMYGAFSCAMDRAMCPVSQLNASIPWHQGSGTALVNFDNVYGGLAHAMVGTSPMHQKPIYRKKDTASLNNFLDQMAEKEVCYRDEKAKIIGEQIDARYVGDSWPRYIFLHARFSAMRLTTEDKIATLTDIHSAFGSIRWDFPLIESVREHSNHFNGILCGLIIEKIADISCLKGSTIDNFSNAYPSLPASFRQYIQRKIEQKNPDVWMCGN